MITVEMVAFLKELAIELYDIQAVKFGEFKTKVGLTTPVYFDLRVVISHPKLMVIIYNLFDLYMFFYQYKLINFNLN